jgi:hypothetical protein
MLFCDWRIVHFIKNVLEKQVVTFVILEMIITRCDAVDSGFKDRSYKGSS